MNFAIVDCTEAEKYPVCGKLDVRTYPAWYYFKPREEFGEQEEPYIVKYIDRHPKSIEAWEKFIFGGGVDNPTPEQMLPITPDGVNAFDRWVNLQWIGITRDVDYIAGKIGISDLPKPIPFVAIVGTFTLTLIIFYWQLFACLREDEADLQAQREKKYR